MNLMFNEISFLPHLNDEHKIKESVLNLLKTFAYAKENFGFTHVVFPSNISVLKITSSKTFIEWVSNISQSDKNKILSIIRKPYVEEALPGQEQSLNEYYYVNVEDNVPQTYCYGLATAYIKKTLCLSLSLHDFWQIPQVDFYKMNENLNDEKVYIKNISVERHFHLEEIKKTIEYLGDVKLEYTNILPKDKPISLRDDHGKDKLMFFSKKIINSRYVTAVINSLPYNPKSINLIKEIYSDGKIELVLYWEDKGIGIIIQTTGRNYRETEAIAKELQIEYDR